MKDQIEEFRPNRLALNSLSALEHTSSPRSFRQFIITDTIVLLRYVESFGEVGRGLLVLEMKAEESGSAG